MFNVSSSSNSIDKKIITVIVIYMFKICNVCICIALQEEDEEQQQQNSNAIHSSRIECTLSTQLQLILLHTITSNTSIRDEMSSSRSSHWDDDDDDD